MTEETAVPAMRQAALIADHAAGGAGAPASLTAGRPTAAMAADQVTVSLPAISAYLSVLRTATAGLAARLDFTLDEIEDLRIAVDEACAMLLGQAIPGADLTCAFALEEGAMTIAVSVPCLSPRAPASDTFAWTVLCALAGEVEARVDDGDLLTIVMHKGRPRAPQSGQGKSGPR